MERKKYSGYFLEDALFMANVGPVKLPAEQLATIQFKDDPEADKELDIHSKFILSELRESEKEATAPDAKWHSAEEVCSLLQLDETEDETEEPFGSITQVHEFKEKFNNKIIYWQKFQDDLRELFTKKLRENLEFGKDLYAALVSGQWYHESDPDKTECDVGSARNAGAFIASMLCYSDYMDWYLCEHSGKVSKEIENAMSAKGWRYK